MDFPENCLKGIPNSSFLSPDGSIASHLFYFKYQQARTDGWLEQSINWEDDASAIPFTLNQSDSNGHLQFEVGIAVIPRGEIDRLNSQPTVKNLIGYERQPLPTNSYHGNILLKSSVPKLTMKKIAAGLALAVHRIIPQNP